MRPPLGVLKYMSLPALGVFCGSEEEATEAVVVEVGFPDVGAGLRRGGLQAMTVPL